MSYHFLPCLGFDNKLEMCWWLAATDDVTCNDPDLDLGDRGGEILVEWASILLSIPTISK